MKITITCQVCGKKLSVVEKDQISADDINSYRKNSSCDVDGPFPIESQFDEDGNDITPALDTSNIMVVKTEI